MKHFLRKKTRNWRLWWKFGSVRRPLVTKSNELWQQRYDRYIGRTGPRYFAWWADTSNGLRITIGHEETTPGGPTDASEFSCSNSWKVWGRKYDLRRGFGWSVNLNSRNDQEILFPSQDKRLDNFFRWNSPKNAWNAPKTLKCWKRPKRKTK